MVATLELTKTCERIDIEHIAERANATPAFAAETIRDFMGVEEASRSQVGSHVRLKMALEALSLGALEEVTRALTWQEFEAFAEDCLASSGFSTWKGLILKEETRRWQIDIVAKKHKILLSIDCKHWTSPSYSSKLTKAAKHQRQALPSIVHHMRMERKVSNDSFWVLPMVLTLLEPRSREQGGVVFVSIGKLSDFLEQVSPCDPDMPFVAIQNEAESSIS